ncbi:MAG: hypothetical protein GEV28_12060 [Actinophytocola sp.]|uniref:hypothetical protein n=1 Tax=Actinophytocola sp. TaxID=1872138 RepID=UPI001328C255|nr:hypothetical protein [Actinophytocola sp.]MPZ81076.1 hypothetical protein [Actinophytocola sp.]
MADRGRSRLAGVGLRLAGLPLPELPRLRLPGLGLAVLPGRSPTLLRLAGLRRPEGRLRLAGLGLPERSRLAGLGLGERPWLRVRCRRLARLPLPAPRLGRGLLPCLRLPDLVMRRGRRILSRQQLADGLAEHGRLAWLGLPGRLVPRRFRLRLFLLSLLGLCRGRSARSLPLR